MDAPTDYFITVPETTLPSGIVVPEFQVGQYHCAKGTDEKAVLDPSLPPWVSINYHEAREACADVGYKLLTETQALAIAYDIVQQDCNWTKGAVGKGKLFRGIRKTNVSSAQPGNFVPSDPKERRWLTLSNGERICDFNGNVYSWIYDDVQGDEDGIIAKAFAPDSPSITTAPYPSIKKGVGWYPSAGYNGTGYVLIRGGYWSSWSDAGVFYLDGEWSGHRSSSVGFRCTK
jgi:formylglycine-generating enzyme required for sulfatase activity